MKRGSQGFSSLQPPSWLVAALVLAALLVSPASATAGSSYLCRGYQDCRAKGKSDYGYQANRKTEWWGQGAGNNCTNYAAFRLITRKYHKMSTTKPWTGFGNAYTWGTYNAGKTNSTPKVGAIAWWPKSTSHPQGHVAYVERVESSGAVWVSDSSAGYPDDGDGFTWRKLTKSGSGWPWPSGFIHFSDEKLHYTTVPSISGTPKVGVTLTANRGSWTSSSNTMRGAPITYKRQWRADGTAISGATDSTFTPTAAQVGKRISVKFTVSSPGYSTVTKVITQGVDVAKGSFTNTAVPIVTGTPEVGATLTATPGKWSPTPSSYRYQWLADGTPIEGATSATHVPSADEEGKRLSVTVTAVKTGYNNATKTSALTSPVAPGEIVYAPALEEGL